MGCETTAHPLLCAGPGARASDSPRCSADCEGVDHGLYGRAESFFHDPLPPTLTEPECGEEQSVPSPNSSCIPRHDPLSVCPEFVCP
jgi:hypothetical protein